MRSAEWIEILWTAINLLGAMGALRLTFRTLERRSALLRQPGVSRTGPRMVAADRYVRNILLRLAFHGLGLAIGLWSMLETTPSWLFAAIVGWALVTMALLFAIASAYDMVDEVRLDRLLRAPDRRP